MCEIGRRAIKYEMKDDNAGSNLMQTRIMQFTYSFQRKIEACAAGYFRLWVSLVSRSGGTHPELIK